MNMTILPPNLAAAACRHYGIESRLDLLQEEMSKAITAISHYRRGRAGCRDELAEELADVLIVMDQILQTEWSAEVEAWVAHKRGRLAERMRAWE